MADYCKSAAEFSSAVGGAKPAVVMFTASWCPPCKAIKPVFQSLPSQFPEVAFLIVDVDELKDVAQQCGIRAMPTFQAYSKGQKIGEVVGADKNAMNQLVQQANSKSSFSNPGQKTGGAGPIQDDVATVREAMAAAAEARMKAVAAYQQTSQP